MSTKAPDELPGLPEALRALVMPSMHESVAVALRKVADEGEVPVGASRLGGSPDLPPGTAWPQWLFHGDQLADWPEWAQRELEDYKAKGFVRESTDPNGVRTVEMPLPFVAQIDLTEVRAVPGGSLRRTLPTNGWLYFFADPNTTIGEVDGRPYVASAVLYLSGERSSRETLVRTKAPAMPAEAHTPAAAMSFSLARELPDPSLLPDRITSGFDRAAWNAVEEAARSTTPASPYHAIGALPFASEIGGDPGADWVSLLRVESDGAVGTHYGDASWLTFAVPLSRLEKGTFSDARAFVFVG